jgi:L-arabinose isomerase
VLKVDQAMPKLPVARALWVPRPDFRRGCQAWLLAGGAHHTSFSRAVTAEQLEDFASMLGIEHVRIGKDTDVTALKQQLRWSDQSFRMGG